MLTELSAWGNGTAALTRCGPTASRHAREVLDIQEELGADVTEIRAEFSRFTIRRLRDEKNSAP